jgi:hydroxyethylthiazole kinase-like uncharacterized protein yjeF
MLILYEPFINSLLKPREVEANKSWHGHAFILAGNVGRMGAALLSSRACLRSGAGLLTVCVPKSERKILQIGIPEAMLEFREENNKDLSQFSALGIGPGMGTDQESVDLFQELLSKAKVPIVIDADALTILSQRPNLMSILPANSILTPHQGEFDRLFGEHKNQESRLETAKERSKEWNCIIVMKGSKTVIVTPSQLFQNTTGNAGLAKAGSGDALTGMICSFLAQGYRPLEATQLAVYLHGLAADLALGHQSMESLLISDVIEFIGRAFEKIRD